MIVRQGSGLYLDTTLMKARVVSHAGGILAHCVRYLIFLPHRGTAVVGNIPPLDTGLLGFSALPSSIILCQGGDTALLTLGWVSEERQKGLSPPSSLETLWNVSFPCSLQALSLQLPRAWFWLLDSFSAWQEVTPSLSWWQLQMSIPVYLQRRGRVRHPRSLVFWTLSLFSEL